MNNKNKTVLHIISDFNGGIASFVRNKADALKESGIIFNILSFNKPDARFRNVIEEMNGNIYQVPNPKKESFTKFYKAVKEVYSEQPDNFIIHSHIQGYRMLPFYLISKKYNIQKFIVHAHTDAEAEVRNSKMNKLNRYINQSVNVQYASCGEKATINIFGNINKPVMIIPNSINPDNFIKQMDAEIRRQKRLEEFNIDDNTLLIGNIGRFHKQKNHKFMIDIIKDLSDKEVKFLWIFIGEGDLLSDATDKVKRLSLEDHVKFLGRRNDIPTLLKLMDYFALPSLYEGLPTVGVESQAAGTPTLLSDTITKESDLELELVKFLSIEDEKQWTDFIVNGNLQRNDNHEQIKQQLINKKFTNSESAQLYVDFLNDLIDEYKI